MKIQGRAISEVTRFSITDALDFFNTLTLDGAETKIAGELLKEIRSRLRFLLDVGLDYLTLDRPRRTLSGGEAQRIRLATQIGSGWSACLRARRALDRPAPARQPKLIDALEQPARHRQHGGGGRARRGDHARPPTG